MMLVPQNVKDIIELCDGIGVLLAMLGAIGAGIRWWMTRASRAEAGQNAIQQVNKMATNDLPHLFEESKKTNEHLEKQTEILVSVDKNIALLVDRTPRA